LLEAGERLPVGRALERLGTGLALVRRGLLPHLAPKGMVGEPLDVFGEPAGIEPLDPLDKLRVEGTTPLMQKRVVRDLIRQAVLEGVFDSGNRLVS
jgi:hypothetical protein